MKKKHRLFIWILAVGSLMRIIPLSQSYWLDEAINVTAARDLTLSYLVTTYSIGDFHPPLYHIFLKPWIDLFGDSEVATRSLSVLFGLITILYTYLLSEKIFGQKKLVFQTVSFPLKIVAPILLATSGLHIYYSGESRMYSIAAMFTAATAFYCLKLLDKQKLRTIKSLFHKRDWQQALGSRKSVLFIIAMLGMLLSDYVPWLLWPLFFVMVPLQSLIALMLTAPWWPYFYRQLTVGLGTAGEFPLWGQVVGGFSIKNIVLIPIKFLVGRVSIDNNLLYAAVLLPILLTTAWLFFQTVKKISKKKLLTQSFPLFWLLVPIIIGIVLSVKISLLSYFRFLFVLPAFYLILAQGLEKTNKDLRQVLLALLFAVNLVSSSAYLFVPQFQRENWRGFVQAIEAYEVDSAVTMIPSMGQAAPYQFYQQTIPIIDNLDDLEELPDSIFLLRYVQEIFDPKDTLRVGIEDLGYVMVEQRDFNGVVVWHYQRATDLFAANICTDVLPCVPTVQAVVEVDFRASHRQ